VEHPVLSIQITQSHAFFARERHTVDIIDDMCAEDLGEPFCFGPVEYDRSFSSKNCLVSEATFTVHVLDEGGKAIHSTPEVQPLLVDILETILCWRSGLWKEALEARVGADKDVDTTREKCADMGTVTSTPESVASATNDLLREKSDFFWESLCQHISERVFATYKTQRLFLFGPSDTNTCDHVDAARHTGVPGADRLIISTLVNGARDPINPQSRRISFDVSRNSIFDPAITLTVYPCMHNATTMPRIRDNQSDFDGQELVITASLPSGRRPGLRSQNTDYCDFNLVFIPLRHLVFEDEHGQPREYDTESAFEAAVGNVLRRSRESSSSSDVCKALEPFLTAVFYGNYLQGHDRSDRCASAGISGGRGELVEEIEGEGTESDDLRAGEKDKKGLTHFQVSG